MANPTLHIALAGNPNCGKTTLFNLITGANGYVGNWPGVTVEKKEAPLSRDKGVIITDLPGIYSLSPYSPEERVSRDYLMSGEPDAVIQVIDATNLERNLYLALQVIETGLPVVVALNMADLVEKSGDRNRCLRPREEPGRPVVDHLPHQEQGGGRAHRRRPQGRHGEMRDVGGHRMPTCLRRRDRGRSRAD